MLIFKTFLPSQLIQIPVSFRQHSLVSASTFHTALLNSGVWQSYKTSRSQFVSNPVLCCIQQFFLLCHNSF